MVVTLTKGFFLGFIACLNTAKLKSVQYHKADIQLLFLLKLLSLSDVLY